MERLVLTPCNLSEVITVQITEDKFPVIYHRKKKELMNSGMSEEEVLGQLSNWYIDLELQYQPEFGLFAVESDAIESSNIFSPYTGEQCINPDDENIAIDKKGNIIHKGDKVRWTDPEFGKRRKPIEYQVYEEPSSEMVKMANDYGECEGFPWECEVIEK